jgi:choline dehydrogenase
VQRDPTTTTFDHIVVGAGSAGCAVAARLSAHARVLLLEAGEMDTAPALQDPAQVLAAAFAPPASVPYATTPQAGLVQAVPDGRGRSVGIHRGVVRGGSSSINGMVWVHGHRADFDGWAAAGCSGWSYDEVLPFYRRIETWAEGRSPWHGDDGPVHVRPLPRPSAVAQAFVQAARALGPFAGSAPDHDYNGAVQQNAACLYRVNVTPDGRRASAAQAYLDPLRGQEALTLMTGARVASVIVEQGRAVGVRCTVGGQERVYRADGEIVLSAGAFESPAILLRSGIGAADPLRALGITPVADLPGVGRNLHDHLQCLTFWMSPQETGQSGFIAEAALFTDSATRSVALPPDLQYHFLAGLPGFLGPTWTPHFICCPVLLTPQSRGSVRLASADPTAQPVIDPAYLAHDADVQVLVRGLQLARELAAQAPLSAYCGSAAGDWFGLAPDNTPLPVPTDAAALAAFVRATASTVWHPVGTCAMGTGPEAVLDPQLRVRGVERLRVADASAMPTITRGNTNAPSVLIGERAAAFIAG